MRRRGFRLSQRNVNHSLRVVKAGPDVSGGHVRMDFRFSESDEQLRSEIRAWLEENLPDKWDHEACESADRRNIHREFARRLAKKGWVAPHWPSEFGGLGFSITEQLVFNEEMAYWEAPTGYISFGVGWAGPTIIVHGTEQQKRRHLNGITDATTMWCQGFSEPNAGSDLASLQTSAVRDGDDYVVNGEKIWTSGAHYADWMILLARTDPNAPKHKGLSYFLVDMKTPGIRISPLIDMMDNHAFNQVLFDDVRVPSENLLGEENRGWYLAATTLDFERSSIGGASRARRMLDDMIRYVQENAVGGRNRDHLRYALAEACADAEIGRLLSYKVAGMQARGLVPNYEASVAKLYNTDMQLRLAIIGVKLMRLYGQLEPDSRYTPLRGRLERLYMWQTGMSVGGGTPEIQRNVIATRGLGLPR